jgi:hypothetical protein
MNLTEWEEYGLAYFLLADALNVTVDGRFYKRAEFVQVFADRVFFATQPFADGVAGHHLNIANLLVDKLIEEKGLSSVNDKWTGVSHQFDPGRYRIIINALIKSNAICQRAQEGGSKFWQEAFARLSKQP